MKILYAYPYGVLGGVCTQLCNRLRELTRDHQVHCLFGRDYGVSAELGPLATLHFGLDRAAALALVAAEQIDLVVVIDAPDYLDWFAGRDHPRRHAVLLEIHTTYVKNLQYLDARGVDIDAALVPSSSLRDALVARRFAVLAGKPIAVVANSVDPDRFCPLEVPATDRPVALWVGKIDDHKDWRAAIRAVSRLPPPLALWLVGGETCADDAARAVVEYAHQQGVVARLRWFDRIDHARMPRLYASVARGGGCQLVTSTDESFGMSAAEGLLSGLPVASAELPAIRELVAAGGGAWARFFPHGDDDAAARAVADLLASDAHAALAAGRDALLARLAPERVAAAYRALLERVAGARAAI